MNVLVMVISVLSLFDFSHAFNETCTENSDCTAQEKTVCLDDVCTCDSLGEYNVDLNKCLQYVTEYGSICYEDWQCDFLGDNSACTNNICACASGYKWYQGKCQKIAKKAESCSTDVICLDHSDPLALTCGDNKVCQCSEGYYDRGEDCRLKSELNSACAISYDCFPTTKDFGVEVYSHCELGKCVKDTKSAVLVEDYAYNVSRTDETFVIIQDDADDPCPNGIQSNFTREECGNCSNTIYFRDSVCICEQGFFLQDDKCIAELGTIDSTAKYTNDSQCPIKPGKLLNGACYCRNYWFQDDTNRECKKTTLQYTQNCMDNDWCKAMGDYAYCNSATEKCECISQAVLNETTFYCNLKEDANLTGTCLSDSECALYETCVDERCQCTEGFYRIDESGLCLPKINQSCEVRDCNHIKNAVCSNEDVCQCESDEYVNDGYKCVKIATKLNQECEIEQQCQNILHSSCLEDSTNSTQSKTRCLCTSEFKDLNGTCYDIKYPGSLCSTQWSCTIMLGDTFVCRNMLCQCPIGKSLNADNVCVGSTAGRLNLNAVFAALVGLLLVLR